MNEHLRVLHIDTGKTWRGGQQQAFYLHRELTRQGYYSMLVCQPASEMSTRCRKAHLPFVQIAMRSELDVFAVIHAIRMCQSHAISIIQAHTAHALSLSLLVRLFCPHLKIIGMRRVDFPIKKNPFSRLKYVTPYLSRLVCISHAIARIARQDGIASNKIEVIHSGIDTRRFSATPAQSAIHETKKKCGINPDSFIIGTVAAFVAHKDYDTLVDAALDICVRHEHVSFCMVGDGPDLPRIRDRIVQADMTHRIHLPGYRTDIDTLLHAFDIFALSSKEEGLCTSLLDAQATGIPIVATTAGGIPEAVIDNYSGVLVKPKSPLLFAEALNRLITDASLRTRMRVAAKKHAASFDISHTVKKTTDLYERLST